MMYPNFQGRAEDAALFPEKRLPLVLEKREPGRTHSTNIDFVITEYWNVMDPGRIVVLFRISLEWGSSF